MTPLLVTTGEPAGIGPDICLELARLDLPIVVAGDIHLLRQRAEILGQSIALINYQGKNQFTPGTLNVLHSPCKTTVTAGELDVANAEYVVQMLENATDACMEGSFSALITAPVHKAIINQSGIPFTGHTEFLANRCKVEKVVMLLSCPLFKVALVTTHLPLQEVPAAINQSLIIAVIKQVNQSLQQDFNIKNPRIFLAGLNPHAGESGYLGREEIDIIEPAIKILQQQGILLSGPHSADTLFSPENIKQADVFVTLYHDQGLPVLKYAGFGEAVNITLGLPIIRTSVDHGTALELAGSGKADAGSLMAAVKMAYLMAANRKQDASN